MTATLECRCQHCQTPMTFEANRIGEKVACPSCGQITSLCGSPGGPAPKLPIIIPTTSNYERSRVVVTDIDMPFISMIFFMVKWAFASIPAVIIVSIVAAVAWFCFLSLFR